MTTERVEFEYRLLLEQYDRDLASFLRRTDDAADDAADAMDDASKRTEKGWRTRMRSVGKVATAAGLAVAGAAAVAGKALLDEVRAAQELRSELFQINQTAGLLPETLSALQLSGAPLDRLGEAAGEFQKRISDAERGTGEALAAFDALGVQVRDLNGDLRTTDDVFREYIGAVQAVESPTERAALLTTAFGGAGRELGAALGSTGLDQWTQLAEHYGVNVGPQAERATREWNVATQNFETAVLNLADSWLLNFGGQGIVSRIIDGFGLQIARFTAFSTTLLSELSADLEQVQRGLAGELSGGELLALAVDLSEITSETNAAAEAAREANLAYFELRNARMEASTALRGTNASAGVFEDVRAAKAAQDNANALIDAAERQADAREELFDVGARLYEQNLEGADAIDARWNAELERIASINQVADDLFLANEARNAVEQARAAELADYEIEQARRAQDEIDRARDEALHARLDREQFTLGAIAQAHQGMTEIVTSLFDRQIEQAREGSKERERLLRQQFAAQKAVALADAAINTALGITNVWASFGAVPPVAAALTAVVAAVGATQVGLIASKKPTFDVGGMIGHAGRAPDQIDIRARAGEGVLTAQGVQAIGGPSALTRANSGQAPQGGGVVVVAYGHRVYDDLTRDSLDSPFSPAARAARRAGRGRQRVGIR
jgi:hypothetical protein